MENNEKIEELQARMDETKEGMEQNIEDPVVEESELNSDGLRDNITGQMDEFLNEDASYFKLNETMKNWLDNEYRNKVEENKEDLSEEEYKDMMELLDNWKERYIDQEYIDDLIENLKDTDFDFLKKKKVVEKYSKRWDRFVRNVCRRLNLDQNIFNELIGNYTDASCQKEYEVKAFKSILYKGTQTDIVIKGNDEFGSYEMKYKYLRLFLKSMKKYNLDYLNTVVEIFKSNTERQ